MTTSNRHPAHQRCVHDVLAFPLHTLSAAVDALVLHTRRKAHQDRPAGRFEGPHWLPADNERCPCCDSIRLSSHWPTSLRDHCCTLEHAARRFHVDMPHVLAVRRALRTLGMVDAMDRQAVTDLLDAARKETGVVPVEPTYQRPARFTVPVTARCVA